MIWLPNMAHNLILAILQSNDFSLSQIVTCFRYIKPILDLKLTLTLELQGLYLISDL